MGTEINGLRETTRALDETAADLQHLDNDRVAAAAADVMRGFMPVRTGRARSTVQPVRAEGRALVTAGGPKAPYVPLLRATHPSRFVERTDQVMETRAAQLYEAEWDQIANQNGLT